jgi:lipoprotein-anchoring transpeptidase ErfK/SrfK
MRVIMSKKLWVISAGVIAAVAVIVIVFRIAASADMFSSLPKEALGDDANAIRSLRAIASKYVGSSKSEKALFRLADLYQKRGDLVAARNTYQKLIDVYPGSKDIQTAEARRSDLNIAVLFSKAMDGGAFEYKVEAGDTLTKIARQFGTTIGLIMTANNLAGSDLAIGQKLKVQKYKFDIIVDKSQNVLTLKSDDKVVKTYRVSTGANNSTPIGTFKIVNKMVNPVWYKTGAVVPPGSPKNILGTRWMGISKPSFGIHGTTDPKSIGKSVSSGCIRMTSQDVEELYAIVPEGTEVVILD